MKLLKCLMVGAVLSFGMAAISSPAFAAEKKAEKKCDADGKECKDGKDCKAEHCKKDAPK